MTAKSIESVLRAGLEARRDGQTADAREFLERATRIRRFAARAWAELGLMAADEDSVAAKEHLRKSLEARPAFPQVLESCLRLAKRCGEERQFYDFLEAAEESNHAFVLWRARAISVRELALGGRGKPIKWLLRWAELAPKNRLPFWHLGLLHDRREGSLDELLDVVGTLATKYPDVVHIQRCYGDLLTASGRYSEAAGRYRTLLATDCGGKPDFMLIGAMKSASTSLFAMLNKHPQFVEPIRKEIHYYDRGKSPGLEWYRAHFPQANGAQFSGEATPNYYVATDPDRILRDFPRVRFLLVLRDPVERAISHFYHAKKVGFTAQRMQFQNILAGAERVRSEVLSMRGRREKILELQAAIRNSAIAVNRFLLLSLYDIFLEVWHRSLDAGRLKVLSTESIREKEVQVDICRFLNVAEHSVESTPFSMKGRYEISESDLPVVAELREFFAPTTRNIISRFGIGNGWA